VQGQRAAGDQPAAPLAAPSFSLERINLPPFTYAMEAKKFTERLPAAQRYIVEHRLNEHLPGSESHLGIVMQGGMWKRRGARPQRPRSRRRPRPHAHSRC
jgi:TPP-dependent indolepyruvate ferredoxin oxidoreductase alpha subunit